MKFAKGSKKSSVRVIHFFFIDALAFIAANLNAGAPDYASLNAEAENLFGEGSYAKSHEIYENAKSLQLAPDHARWVAFRLADTLWRSQAGTQTADPTKYEQAQQQLDVLVRDIKRVEDRDRVWVEVQESLGDFYWSRNDSKNWGQAWPHYQNALDWWAGAKEIELARKRYLKIVWAIARPQWAEPFYYYGYYGNSVPLEILENVLKIAQTEADKTHAHYLIAMTLRNQGGDWDMRRRIPEEFEAALKPGKSTDWYDDALYYYAEWMSNNGRVVPMENGQFRQEPDYAKALELFRRIVNEHLKGETKYYEQARQQIDNITKPIVGVGVSNIFLPDSEIQFQANWRNVKKINFTLHQIDLPRDLKLEGDRKHGGSEWLQAIDLKGTEPVKSWSKDTEDKGDYKPGQDAIRFDGKLPAGAYLLEATGAAAPARDLILVTDASLVVKSSGKQALVYFCNALDGSPVAQADLKLWRRWHDGKDWIWAEVAGKTDPDGCAVFDLTKMRGNNGNELFVVGKINDRQAFSNGYSSWYQFTQEAWKIYAFTDRAAYRPEEKVQWKFIARRYNGSVYLTPAHQTIEYEIDDPRGTKASAGQANLNAFGSAWGSLELNKTLPLGEYRINFWEDAKRQKQIGSATLFRLEEYKLPEFKVSVQTPEENGKKKSFRLGEKVEATVQADYYFGGPVADASVEFIVYQNPFYHWWFPHRDYPWFYEDMNPRWNNYGGQGQIIKRETLKTDAVGKTTIAFDTPRGSNQDFEYRIEARVTDASRREITGNGTVRVTRQRYYVYPRADHNLYRPQDKVKIEFKAQDANDQPQQIEGTVKVTRDFWYEIWIDPKGREVKGDELRALQEKRRIFPPPSSNPPNPSNPGWQLKFRGYQHDVVLTRTLKTDAQGEAELTFTPERDGYYNVAWTSQDQSGEPITAQTAVWVATNATTELGYRHGGLEIIVDKDTFRAGQKAPVMLSVPTNDRFVLFTVEGDELYNYQLIRMSGTAKLIELPIEEKHVPNIFLGGVMVSDRQIFMDTKQVVVPPVEHYLDVEIKPDRDQYQPREEGTLTVTAKDHTGEPVAAEIALSLADEAVSYIQQDYAGDPRQFYYGTKRQPSIQVQSTFNLKSYAKLNKGQGEQLIEETGELRDSRGGSKKKDFWRYDRTFSLQETDALFSSRGTRSISAADESVSGALAKRELGGWVGGNFPASAPVAAKSALAGQAEAKNKPAEAGNEKEPAVVVRSDFRSTVFWQPDLVTDKSGKATVKIAYPDSLTGWKASSRAATATNQFGIASASTRTQQPLIVRLEAPRFFVVGDAVTISAVVNNNTDSPMTVKTLLDADGIRFADAKIEAQSLKVAARSEARADWTMAVERAGGAKLKVTARADQFADAMEKTYPVHEHGIEKFISKSGKVRGDAATVKLEIPKERKPESTTLTVQIAPSPAVTMLDALPYLIDYPYGCTEQTMSRFLPAAITAKTLKDLGLKPETAMDKIFGGIERETADRTHPKGKKDLRELDAMVKKGLNRLYDFQHGDGGWGWWKDGESDHYMTAYVVWGLTLAREAGIEIKNEALNRGADYLDKTLVEEESNFDQQAWMLHALAVHHAVTKKSGVGQFQQKAVDNLWANRDKLNAYTRALFALSVHAYGFKDKAKTLIENLENGVKRDDTPDVSIVQEGNQQSHGAIIGTAHWGEDGVYWRWSDGGIEATCFALRALLAVDPKSPLIEPVSNWLVKNRRGAQWSNTRDTAIAVLTFNDYLRASGELNPELEYELAVNGTSIVKKKLTAEDALGAPSRFEIDRKLLRDGANEIRIIRKSGNSPIYFSADTRFFSLEEPIAPAGNEIFVRRQYYKLVGRPTLLKGYVYDKQPMNDGESVASGERVESVLTIESKNNYEYLVFEDLKPAGLEAVEVRSGQSLYAKEIKSGAATSALRDKKSNLGDESDYTGRSRWVYQELRDRKIALFLDKLPEGIWEIRTDLRAEIPGKFHALPATGQAMYIPEIRCNGSEVRITIVEKEKE